MKFGTSKSSRVTSFFMHIHYLCFSLVFFFDYYKHTSLLYSIIHSGAHNYIDYFEDVYMNNEPKRSPVRVQKKFPLNIFFTSMCIYSILNFSLKSWKHYYYLKHRNTNIVVLAQWAFSKALVCRNISLNVERHRSRFIGYLWLLFSN